MKHIAKGQPPTELAQWYHGQLVDGHRINCDYDNMPGEVREAVKQRLLEDQGWLCCYTGIRVSAQSSHVEHLKPQTLCTESEDDIDYRNMLAAYPGDRSPNCEFGAKAKGSWYDEELLVSPLNPHCEAKFRFDQFGRVHPATPHDAAAIETIRHLGLDCGRLTSMRERAIEEMLFDKDRTISKAQLKTIIDNFCKRNHNRQQFPAFCFAIVQAAKEVLGKAERDQQRREQQHRAATRQERHR